MLALLFWRKGKKGENSIEIFTNLTSITYFRYFNCFGFPFNCSFFNNNTLFFPMMPFCVKLRLIHSYNMENSAIAIYVTNTSINNNFQDRLEKKSWISVMSWIFRLVSNYAIKKCSPLKSCTSKTHMFLPHSHKTLSHNKMSAIQYALCLVVSVVHSVT